MLTCATIECQNKSMLAGIKPDTIFPKAKMRINTVANLFNQVFVRFCERYKTPTEYVKPFTINNTFIQK